ncbi:MAG: hypothetical protein NT157_03305 [Candidatus Micrarchaeota archaeon]|nr:hypothetical protein [Candidatus Micrarchaeota archaeon]
MMAGREYGRLIWEDGRGERIVAMLALGAVFITIIAFGGESEALRIFSVLIDAVAAYGVIMAIFSGRRAAVYERGLLANAKRTGWVGEDRFFPREGIQHAVISTRPNGMPHGEPAIVTRDEKRWRIFVSDSEGLAKALKLAGIKTKYEIVV